MLIEKVQYYLSRVLQIEQPVFRKVANKNLPLYLSDRYELYVGKLLGVKLCIMADKYSGVTPAQIKKDNQKLSEIFNEIVIYVSDNIESYDRQRLIAHQVQFIMPENQMFIPVLGIDLREYFAQRKRERKKLTPSAQAYVISSIYKKDNYIRNLTQSSIHLEYTKMSMGRVFDDLEKLGLAVTFIEDKERYLNYNYESQALWDNALPFMKSPVNKSFYVKGGNSLHGCLSGLSALAELTMISHPKITTIAMTLSEWKQYEHKFQKTSYPEEADYQIEIWGYSPEKILGMHIVDKLSLYLSLRNDEDERVQGELEEMMEHLKW